MKKVALITGINGQDGSYLAEFLLNKNYKVHGLIRRSSLINTERIDHIYQSPQERKNFFLHYGDLTDAQGLNKLISEITPDEIYNLGAQSHVAVSFNIPEYTANTDALGTLRILESIISNKLEKKTKIYQASTSELFGKAYEVPQNESTPFYPRSPYGVAKLYGFWITKNYRESYGIHASNGILFNHESPRRGETFVTRKITKAAARIKLGKQKKLYLGNLDAKRDWGHAKDYVEMMWKILQQKNPDDYVAATGRTETVRYFAEQVFKFLDIDLVWKGNGINEVGVNKKNGNIVIQIDQRYFRPSEVDILQGDASKAHKKLKWKPKITLEELIHEMVSYDYEQQKEDI